MMDGHLDFGRYVSGTGNSAHPFKGVEFPPKSSPFALVYGPVDSWRWLS